MKLITVGVYEDERYIRIREAISALAKKEPHGTVIMEADWTTKKRAPKK